MTIRPSTAVDSPSSQTGIEGSSPQSGISTNDRRENRRDTISVFPDDRYFHVSKFATVTQLTDTHTGHTARITETLVHLAEFRPGTSEAIWVATLPIHLDDDLSITPMKSITDYPEVPSQESFGPDSEEPVRIVKLIFEEGWFYRKGCSLSEGSPP
ncbi:hypothetical protein M231_05879 [Tremella mesenterica]|uniref:Uncharacterized protein n=1 Tax=Tremella mesenterica TaxID=5217 RepID=A0A4Q1BH01_TREME|nr:hypothetical protein M231_05879 [Tremella mesenterica]